MKNIVLTAFALSSLISFGAQQALASDSSAPTMGNPSPGAAAPDFNVVGQNGKSYKLSALKGKIVVLEWMNPGCPFSKAQYSGGNTQMLQKKYTAKGVIWLSVDSSAKGMQGCMDSDQDANNFISAKNASPTALVRDLNGSLGMLYGAKTTPHLFVIDAKGLLAYKGAMDDTPTTDPADIPKSHNWVSAALDNLIAGKPVAVPETKPYGCGVKYAD
jgi:peroxiredoxin